MIIKKLVLLLFFLSSQAFAALNSEDFLTPDQAFKVSANMTDTGQARVVFTIADKYYLYKKRMQFKSKNQDVILPEVSLPKGKTKEDKNFGTVEVFYNKLTVDLPITNSKAASSFDLEVKYQGCADAGLCYAPEKKTFTLQLASNSSGTDKAKALGNSLGITRITEKKGEPLTPEQAFGIKLNADKDNLVVSWRVTPKHYLYKKKLRFQLKSPDGIELGDPIFPASTTKTDPTGTNEVFEQDFKIQVPLKNAKVGDEITLDIFSQGCSDTFKICYAPQKQTKTVAVSNTKLPTIQPLVTSSPSPTTSDAKPAAQTTNEVKGKCDARGDQHAVLSELSNASTIGAILIFFLIGLGLAFTPCIYPMIPILSSIIVGQGSQVSTQKAFVLSLAYVLPMAFIYAIAGYFIGNSGENLQAMFQNPWVLSGFALIFVLLSLSMFGFYDLQMPTSIQNKLTNISNSQESGSIIGAAIMGALSALIVGPCVTAPLIAAFTYIAKVGSPLLGTIDMFALGIGIGIPLLLIGTSAGQLLPRAGAWMETTKAVFGVMMLGLAISMLERILPASATMSLAAILLIVTAIYMGALEQIEEAASNWRFMAKGLGIIALIYGTLLMIGASTGHGNLYQPLKGVFDSASSEQHAIKFQQVKGIDGLKAALESAKQQNRPVMLDFTADWCVYCKEMERTTFVDKKVLDAFENTLFLQADITHKDELDKSLLDAYGLMVTPPMILFFDSKGEEQKDYRLFGKIGAEQLTAHAKNFINCFGTK